MAVKEFFFLDGSTVWRNPDIQGTAGHRHEEKTRTADDSQEDAGENGQAGLF